MPKPENADHCDRNKTDLTNAVTQAATLWLDGRGFKPIETEVPVTDGWVADIASAIDPTFTEIQDLKLVRRKPGWKQGRGASESWYSEANAARRFMTAIVEVKASRGDFLGDRKWTAESPASLRYLCFPSGMLRIEEWPAGWGVLVYHENSGIRCERPAEYCPISESQECSVVYSIALRRDHNTRYERLREWQRTQRLRRNEDVSRTRVRNAIQAALAIARGKHGSVEHAFEYYGIRKVHPREIEDAGKLWGIAQEVLRA